MRLRRRWGERESPTFGSPGCPVQIIHKQQPRNSMSSDLLVAIDATRSDHLSTQSSPLPYPLRATFGVPMAVMFDGLRSPQPCQTKPISTVSSYVKEV